LEEIGRPACHFRVSDKIMSSERRNHDGLKRVASAILLAAVIAVCMVAPQYSDPTPQSAVAGVSGMARPHPPLDRAPGQPLQIPVLTRLS
jgi:tellurite resistance protein